MSPDQPPPWMMQDPIPSVPAHRLTDPAYRRELLNKVESLLSVLEIARTKVQHRIERKGGDSERLRKVLHNLDGTVDVCRRARSILINADDGSQLPVPFRQRFDKPMNYRQYLEVASFAEYCRFRELGPISRQEIFDTDLEALCEALVGEDAA